MTATTQRTSAAPGPSPWVRVLLLAVLLTGFGAMHTLGHADHGASGHGAAAHAGTDGPGAGDAPSPDARVGALAHTAHGPVVRALAHAVDTASDALPDLDPGSVCPVLTAPGPPPAGPAAAVPVPWSDPPAPAAALCALRRYDPPSVAAGNRPLLSDLQVLRI